MKSPKAQEQVKKVQRSAWYPVSLMIALFVASRFAGPNLGNISFTGMDKIIHVLVFGLLATGWYEVLRGPAGRVKASFGAILLTVGFGVFDEFQQSMNPARYFEILDMVADTIGAVLAVVVYHRWREYRRILVREFEFRQILALFKKPF